MSSEFKVKIPGTNKAITMTGQDIKVFLLRRGKTIQDLADAIGEKHSATSRVLGGSRFSPEKRQKIADQITRWLAEMPQKEQKLIVRKVSSVAA